MKSLHSFVPAILALPLAIAAVSSARADEYDPNLQLIRGVDHDAMVKLSVGAAAAWFEDPSSGSDADMAGVHAALTFPVAHIAIFDAYLRGSYTYLNSTDSSDLERQDSDVDLVFATSFIGFLEPYFSIGASYDRFDAISYSGTDDWDPGVAYGAGVNIALLPGILRVTPAVRYVDADHTDTLTTSLDAELSFTAFDIAGLGVGAFVAYEDNETRDGDILTGVLYASLHF